MMMFGSLLFFQDECVPEAQLYDSRAPLFCLGVMQQGSGHDGVCQSAVLPGPGRA